MTSRNGRKMTKNGCQRQPEWDDSRTGLGDLAGVTSPWLTRYFEFIGVSRWWWLFRMMGKGNLLSKPMLNETWLLWNKIETCQKCAIKKDLYAIWLKQCIQKLNEIQHQQFEHFLKDLSPLTFASVPEMGCSPDRPLHPWWLDPNCVCCSGLRSFPSIVHLRFVSLRFPSLYSTSCHSFVSHSFHASLSLNSADTWLLTFDHLIIVHKSVVLKLSSVIKR